MTKDHSLSPFEEITSETLTDEIIASHMEQGFTLVFAEEVMRYDLALALPHVASLPSVSYLTWDDQSVHAFFTAYEAAFGERPGFPGWSEEQWVRWASEDPVFRPDLSFLAVAAGQAVGFVTNAEYEELGGRTGYIDQVGVHPQWRSQGLGAALVTRSLQAWQEEGKEAVRLHVNVNNPRAIRLFQHLGFIIVGRRGRMRKLSE